MPATRVLVVEDERIVAMHLRQQLQKLAYEVPAVAHSGRQALRSIEEDKPDIVLMDIHIDGEMDGIETAAKIPADLGIPVIYLTAYSDDGTLARARNTGPSGYLVKPFSERELHATIQMAMERRRTDAAAREHGRELEELVIARTASLSSALRQLEAETAEREAAEAALRQAQKMEAVGHLTGGIAHDFNNLLTVVSGSLELIRDNPADTARVLRLARSAIGAAERGAALISQLLMFSGRKAVRPEPVGLNEMIADLQVLMGHASGAGCQIVIRMQHLLDPVLVDVAELQAAILNLVINAGEAIRGQGRIAIETDSVVVGPGIRRSGRSHHATSCQDLMPGRYVVLTVSDNGDGIAPDLLPRVFEPFFTTKEVGKGSGLGLSQVYGFAAASGGQAMIYSEPGIGTTARIYLPACGQEIFPAKHAAAKPPTHLHQGEGTVLVVEDDSEVGVLATEVLAAVGYKVLSACNAREALAILNSRSDIDIMFSDVVMPGGMNGLELGAEASRLRPGMKILLTSGFSAEALAAQSMFDRNVPILSKPYSPGEMLDRISAILRPN